MSAELPSRPILFNGEMVRAILEGRKTQTRRVVKPQPSFIGDEANSALGHAQEALEGKCPFGVPGNRLWVREAFMADASLMDDMRIKFAATPERVRTIGPGSGDVPDAGLPLYYRMIDKAHAKGSAVSFPSIFMPRWASRIDLEVTAVRVERLNDISEADAIAEGVCSAMPFLWRNDEWQNAKPNVARYAGLWESINGPGSWKQNPWVWVVKFKRVEARKGQL